MAGFEAALTTDYETAGKVGAGISLWAFPMDPTIRPPAGRLLLFDSTADLQRSSTTMDAEVGEVLGRAPDGTPGAARGEDQGSAR